MSAPDETVLVIVNALMDWTAHPEPNIRVERQAIALAFIERIAEQGVLEDSRSRHPSRVSTLRPHIVRGGL
jgi:hypothetical protein